MIIVRAFHMNVIKAQIKMSRNTAETILHKDHTVIETDNTDVSL